jgi:hypothetical protein
MDRKRTFNNLVMIKLDPENKSIKLRNGYELYVDTSFDTEKHTTVTGEIYGLPSRLLYTGEANNGMPWETPLEIKYGDNVICYYLSIVNALKPEQRRYVLEGQDRYVWIPYQTIYAVVREGKILPVNGYVLIEPAKNPMIEAQRERMKKMGLELVKLNDTTKDQANYGIVRYISTPNRQYVDEGVTDEGVDIAVGDIVVIKKTNDIPLQYELHQKVNEGKKLWRCQRRNILAKI